MSNSTFSSTAPTHVNETKVRFIATGVFIITLLYIFTGYLFFPLFLAADFALRAFDLGRISPLALLAERVVKTLKVEPKPIFYPPKRFAARIGLVFAVVLLVLQLAGVNHLPVSITLLVFSALEAFAGICAGCYVYSWIQPLFPKDTAPSPAAQVVVERPVKEITVQELEQWKQENISFQFIDVREPHEYEAANLGAELIPLGTILEHASQIRTDVPVVVQCRSGARSAKAIRLLEDTFGWKNLHNLKGGILAYQAEIEQK